MSRRAARVWLFTPPRCEQAIAADRRLLVAVNHTKQDSEAWAGHPTLYHQSGSLVHSYIVCDFYLSEIALGISFLTGWLSLIALRRQLCQMFPEWAEVAPTWVAHALLFAGLVLPVFVGWVRAAPWELGPTTSEWSSLATDWFIRSGG